MKQKKEKHPFRLFIDDCFKEINESTGSEWSTESLAEALNIDYNVFRKKLNGSKPINKRDFVIAIGIVLQLSVGEIEHALQLVKMPLFNPKDERDALIESQISEAVRKQFPKPGKKGASMPYDLTINRLNLVLKSNGFLELDIHDWRAKKSIDIDRSSVEMLPYRILKEETSFSDSHTLYYGDQYDSLSTTYSPFYCSCYGKMLIFKPKSKETVELFANTEGSLSSRIIGADDLEEYYSTLDDERVDEYKEYFLRLISSVNLLKEQIVEIRRDTKNYRCRTSARVMKDSLVVFSEEFNYSVPELNEYFLLFRVDGNYGLYVYEESAFMRFYLNRKKYGACFKKSVKAPKETYSSIDQLDALIDSVGVNHVEGMKYALRKKAYERLKANVDNLFEDIKARKVHIQNPRVFDDSAELIEYYHVDEDILGKERIMPDGNVIILDFEDIETAFDLGIETIDDIYRLKSKYGSITRIIR